MFKCINKITLVVIFFVGKQEIMDSIFVGTYKIKSRIANILTNVNPVISFNNKIIDNIWL